MKLSAFIAFATLALTATAFADGDDHSGDHHHHPVRQVTLTPGGDLVVEPFQHGATHVSCQLADDTALLPSCTLLFSHADDGGRNCPSDYPYGVAVGGNYYGTVCFTTGADALAKIADLRSTKSCQ